MFRLATRNEIIILRRKEREDEISTQRKDNLKVKTKEIPIVKRNKLHELGAI